MHSDNRRLVFRSLVARLLLGLLGGAALPAIASGQSADGKRVRVALVQALPDTLARAAILRFRDATRADVILLPARTATPKDLAMAAVLLRNLRRTTPTPPGDARIVLTGGAPPERGSEPSIRRFEALLKTVRDTPPRPVEGYGRVAWAEVDIS